MIKDKELGLKVAENEEEAYWETTRQDTEKALIRARAAIEINEAILKICKSKIKCTSFSSPTEKEAK